MKKEAIADLQLEELLLPNFPFFARTVRYGLERQPDEFLDNWRKEIINCGLVVLERSLVGKTIVMSNRHYVLHELSSEHILPGTVDRILCAVVFEIANANRPRL